MKNVEDWTALYVSKDLPRARMLATCLSAMDFDVTLEVYEPGAAEAGSRLGGGPPHVVRVRAADHPELLELLDEILEEQLAFDRGIDVWHERATHAEQRLLITMIVVVSALAIVGAIKL